MRIDLLFGFLGSGKTTLATRVLKERGGSERLALIVNEFGDVGIDGEILKGKAVDMIQLTSGCLCCTLKGSLLKAIDEIASKTELDHVVIEATGVAEPEELIETFSAKDFSERYEIGPITTIVDAARFEKLRDMLGPFYEAQLQNADLIVLNKIDQADAEALDSVYEEVREANPHASLIFAERCDIDIGALMDAPQSGAMARYLAEIHGTSRSGKDDHHDHDHHHGHDHRHAPADSFVVDLAGPVNEGALERFFAEAPEGLWRAKGFVEISGRTCLVQYALSGLEVTDTERRARHYLVFIGQGLDRAQVTRTFLGTMSAEAAR